MLTELKIENFRLFKDLKIDGLKQVNLFAGKNNSGKTALLEALRIMAAKEDLSVIEYILQQRGYNSNNFWEAYSELFFRPELQKHSIVNDTLTLTINDFHIRRTKRGEKNIMYQLSTNGVHTDFSTLKSNIHSPQPLFPRDTAVFVPFGANNYFPLEQLWDSIVLTPKEDQVMEILKESILPDLVRLDVKPDRTLVRLKGENKPVPLKSLGDGAQRILVVAVALVSAKDNLLLLDEIEAGLHYSVLEKLWAIIFKYAKELNVQVFATTHSSDAVKSFTYLLEEPENREQGAFFRLQNNLKSGLIEAIPYDLEKLELSLEANIEPR